MTKRLSLLLLNSLLTVLPTNYALANQCITNIDDHAHHMHLPTSRSCTLDLSHCNITIEQIPTIIAYIKKDDFNRIDLADNDINEQGINKLIEANMEAYSINLSKNNISDKSAAMLANSSNISQLYLNDNNITDKGAIALAKNTKIINLQLNHNQIGNAGLKELAKNVKLQTLGVAHNQFDAEGLVAFTQNNVIDSLNISDNHLNYTAADIIAKMPQLKFLYANNNQFSDKGAVALAKKATRFIDINLAENNIGDVGANALSRLETTYLNLNNNHISARGAQALAKNDTVRTLQLNNNEIGDTGIASFSNNRTLTYLYVDHNHITASGVKRLTQTKLHDLHINDNEVGDEGMAALNKLYLEFIYIRNNNLHDAAVKPFINFCALRLIDISNNHISHNAIDKLRESCGYKKVIADHNDG